MRVATRGFTTFFTGATNNSTGTERMRLDSSGNLGLGVTPSAWSGIGTTLQVNTGGSFSADAANAYFAANSYYNGTNWIYQTTNNATRYTLAANSHLWYTAPSGTAGATTSITSGRAYSVTTLGSTTLGEWQAFFSALTGIPSIGQTVTATATGTLAGGATVTQIVVFTQAMTLDANGSLAVGGTTVVTSNGGVTATTTASGSIATSLAMRNAGTANGSGSYLNFRGVSNTGAEHDYCYLAMVADDTTAKTGSIRFSTTAGSSPVERARISSDGTFRVKGAGTAGSTEAFQVSGSAPADAARLDSNGYFDVDCTATPDGTTRRGFQVVANTGVNDTTKILIATTTTSTRALAEFNNGNGNVGSISVTGSATAYNTSSDYRLKDNPQPLTNSGAFIDALKPKTWNWKADGSKGVGFIAHEVQEVSPGSVVGGKDGEQMQAMEYGSAEFIANIVAELQSLRARVAQLEQGV
jgi:hypothetical protein